jgi:hypothetical protein
VSSWPAIAEHDDLSQSDAAYSCLVSSPAGWYPDPGGQRGAFRYWNGSTWSSQLSPSASAPPPFTSGLGQPSSSAPQFGQAGYQPGMGYTEQTRKRRIGPWIGIVVGVVVVALLAVVIFQFASKGNLASGGASPGGNTTTNPCPENTASMAPVQHTADGRVHGGLLSYPELASPWSAPTTDVRVPYGRDVSVQEVMVEPNYNGTNSWVASVLVGELAAGDGFFSPQEGSEIVVKCLIGAFYDNAVVGRADTVNKATTVGGKDAWLVETHLTFDIQGLKTKGETAIVLIVATGTDTSSLYYASIPDTVPQYVQTALDTMAALTVGN